jgi:hypothetical protein
MEGGDRGVRIRVSADVKAVVRANLIGHLAREVSKSIGLNETALNTVYEGFRDALLEQVEVQFFGRGSSDRADAYLSMSCDWDRHVLILTTGTGPRELHIDPTKSIGSQISRAFEAALSFARAKLAELDIVSHAVVYTAAAGRNDEFREKYGTIPLTDKEQQSLALTRFSKELVVSPGEVSEFTMIFRYRESE